MADICAPDMWGIYFQHKTLTCILGQPHLSFLWVLIVELKANASSVPSTLGGGMYGHLVPSSSQQYATSLEEEFNSPTNPGSSAGCYWLQA